MSSKRILASIAILVVLGVNCIAEETQRVPEDQELAADLNLLQGRWELKHGPNMRSVKTVKGNTETVRRYDARTGELVHEHQVTFKLSKSGPVRVFTFFIQPDQPGLSFVYKVDKTSFWDIPGLLHGQEFQNYQPRPKIYQWTRLPEQED